MRRKPQHLVQVLLKKGEIKIYFLVQRTEVWLLVIQKESDSSHVPSGQWRSAHISTGKTSCLCSVPRSQAVGVLMASYGAFSIQQCAQRPAVDQKLPDSSSCETVVLLFKDSCRCIREIWFQYHIINKDLFSPLQLCCISTEAPFSSYMWQKKAFKGSFQMLQVYKLNSDCSRFVYFGNRADVKHQPQTWQLDSVIILTCEHAQLSHPV